MLRDLLASRAIQGGLFFFVLIGGGSLLYSWHVERTTAAELQQTIQTLRALKNQNKVHNSQDPDAHRKHDTAKALVHTVDQNTETPMPTAKEALSNETETLDLADVFLPEDFVLEDEAPAEDVPVSPYGFGPYPEVPAEMPADTFPSPSADHELIARVRIKLLAEGINARGVNMEKGWVYPVIPGIAFVKWKEYERPDGTVRYISDMIAHPSDGFRIAAIRDEKGRTFTAADIPSDIKLMSFEEGEIDPYTFLRLPRH